MTLSMKAGAVCLAAATGLSGQAAMAEPESVTIANGETLTIDDLSDINVTVAAGGLLTGSAGVTGSVLNNGRFAPGAGIADFVIFDGFQQSSTGILDIDISTSGASDAILVFGSVELGGTVNINPIADANGFVVGADHSILTSDDSITGSISGLTVSNDLLSRAFIRPSISVEDSELVVSFDPLSFVSSGLTANQLTIATALDNSLGQSGGDLTEFTVDLGLLPLDGAVDPIQQLVPETAAVLSTTSIRSSQMFHSVLEGQISRGATNKEGWSGWASGYGGFGENTNRQRGAVSAFEYDTYGLAVGADHAVGESARIGFALGVSQTDLDIRGAAKEAEQKSLQASAYGSYQPADIRFSAAVSVGYNDFETEQRIALAAGSPTSTGDFDGYVIAGSAEAAYVARVDNWQVEGFAGLDVHSAHQDDYRETGSGTIGFDINSKTETSFRSRVGGRFKLWNGTATSGFAPEVKVAWVHEFSYDENAVSGQFAGLNTTQFTVAGARPSEDFAEIEAGFTVPLGNSSSLYASYNGLIGSDENVHGATAGIRFRW